MSEPYSTFAGSVPALVTPPLVTDIILVTRGGVAFALPPTFFQPATLSYSYETPVTGDSLVAVATLGAFVLDPAGELATLTVTLPPNPIDGQIFEVSSTQDIDALTALAAAGDNISGGTVGVLAANGGVSWRWVEAQTTWYRRS